MQRKYSTSKAAAWAQFSRYIRNRDAIKYTGTLENSQCFFCGKELPRGETQAGHMLSRAYSGALFNPEVVFASCVKCNTFYEGNHVLGFLHLQREVGQERAIDILLNAMKPAPLAVENLEDIEEGYKMAADILESEYKRMTEGRH